MNRVEQLVDQLWGLVNKGQTPFAIRMAHSTYCQYMRECAAFEKEMDYSTDPINFQGLPVIFDSWCVQPKIDSRAT